MKIKLAYLLSILTISLLLGCNKHQNKKSVNKSINKDTSVEQTSIKVNSYIIDSTLEKASEVVNSFSTTDIQGVWAVNKQENALFIIKDDSLYYTENQEKPLAIEIKGDTLLMFGDILVHCKILKLNKDSLWYKDEFNKRPTKLFKIKS